jgi:3-hydroxyethyl bacteriochlorophyllide a dehydrogenase
VDTLAVVFEQPEVLTLKRLALVEPGPADVVVAVEYTGISTGTERLLYTGKMPPFPGLGYPLVPGYETVGRVVEAGPDSGHVIGETVYVTGARCYQDARGLFGGAARRLIVPGAKAWKVPANLGEQGALFALAATAYHAIVASDRGFLPDLIIGHGALGRLIARITMALDPEARPTVWETNPIRRQGTYPYLVIDPSEETRKDYRCIHEVAGANGIVDQLVMRLAPKGEIVLAGFYHEPVAFNFPFAFIKEARLRIAAEWTDADLQSTIDLVRDGRLSLDGLVTHRVAATDAPAGYATAFTDPGCVKMVLDWRSTE